MKARVMGALSKARDELLKHSICLAIFRNCFGCGDFRCNISSFVCEEINIASTNLICPRQRDDYNKQQQQQQSA